jgi:hypothetical protein
VYPIGFGVGESPDFPRCTLTRLAAHCVQLEEEAAKSGGDLTAYASSTVVSTSAPKELGTLRQADGSEGFQK